MLRTFRLAGGAVLIAWSSIALADDAMSVAGRQVSVVNDAAGSAVLTVDGAVLHENGVIYLDPEPLLVGGVTVVTGSAGAGGNACNAAPFVLALPDSGAPEFYGPINTCTYLVPETQVERLLFISEASSNDSGRIRPDEVWTWTPDAGFSPAFGAMDIGSSPAPGWEAFDELKGAHPVDALAITPVLEALQAGLGPDYSVFAERISDLGSGDLTAEGYLGQACIKFTCDADFAVLYIHKASQQVFAIWHVGGEVENQVWPKDTSVWPPEAMAALQEVAGE